eukprot:Clim_evm24s136 gene=Clim_evmTU24s136
MSQREGFDPLLAAQEGMHRKPEAEGLRSGSPNHTKQSFLQQITELKAQKEQKIAELQAAYSKPSRQNLESKDHDVGHESAAAISVNNYMVEKAQEMDAYAVARGFGPKLPGRKETLGISTATLAAHHRRFGVEMPGYVEEYPEYRIEGPTGWSAAEGVEDKYTELNNRPKARPQNASSSPNTSIMSINTDYASSMWQEFNQGDALHEMARERVDQRRRRESAKFRKQKAEKEPWWPDRTPIPGREMPKDRGQTRPRTTVVKPFFLREKDPFKTMRLAREIAEKRQQKEEAELAECSIRFKATPLDHDMLKPKYDKMVTQQKTRRRTVKEHGRDILASKEKPFSFYMRDLRAAERKEREVKLRKEKEAAEMEARRRSGFRATPIPRDVLEPKFKDMMALDEGLRQMRIKERATKLLKEAHAPGSLDSVPKKKSVYRDPDETFAPKINKRVPDLELPTTDPFSLDARGPPHKTTDRVLSHCSTSVVDVFGTDEEQMRLARSILGLDDEEGGSSNTRTAAKSDRGRKGTKQKTPSLHASGPRPRQTRSQMLRELAARERLSKFKRDQIPEGKLLSASGSGGPHQSKNLYIGSHYNEPSDQRARELKAQTLQQEQRYRRQLEAMEARISIRPFLFEREGEYNRRETMKQRIIHHLEDKGMNPTAETVDMDEIGDGWDRLPVKTR